MSENKNTCPGCDNHCTKEQIKCPRGAEFFGIEFDESKVHGKHGEHHGRHIEKDDSAMTPADKVLNLLRQCGHYLHHNVGHGQQKDASELLSGLSEDEQEMLIALLKKCLKQW